MLACTKEDQVSLNNQRIPIQISCNQISRANDSTYETNDEVGIFVVNYTNGNPGSLAVSGNQADNERFTFNGTNWTPDETIYWKDQSTAADFYAYYPYSESVNISAHPFSVMADQSTEDNFWASDFLWGKATKVTPTSAAVPIVTNHSLSKILLAIEPGNGFTEESWAAATKSVKICNVKTNATIDLASGVATATGDDGEIIPLATDGGYKAMIVPQTIADNSKLIVVTVDGTEYVYRTGITFKANTQHRFVITVNKKGGNVDVTIGEWEMDENINEGNAEEESEATIPNNEIWYTATAKIEPSELADFGATIESNEWDSTIGKGVITFDGDVTSLDNAFLMCDKLTSVILPNSITSIGKQAFSGCTKLANINIPNGVKSIGGSAFYYCLKLENILIPEGVESIGDNAFDNSGLQTIELPNSVVTIGEYSFNKCSSLQSAILPNKIKVTGKAMFSNCSNLRSITIPDSVETISTFFACGCINIETITIPCNIKAIGDNAFAECSNLQKIFCNPIVAPTIEYFTFHNVNNNLEIYVPTESVDDYKIATGWSDYADCIVGYDF